MKKSAGRVLLIINLHKERARALGEEIAAVLGERGTEAVSFAFDGKPGSMAEGPFDLVISLGGDGTVLYAAREVAGRGTPILPINMGNLGFIAAVSPNDWLSVYEKWETGNVIPSERLMLNLSLERRGREVFKAVCLNDTVICASGIAKIIRLSVEGETVKLGKYRSDGLIVATPTGSTAYSVAAGGPILDPEMEAVIINPICPFTLSNRPLVAPADETIVVRVEEEQRSGVLLTVDGQLVEKLEPEDVVRLSRAPFKARFIASDRRVFYEVLRSKLNWSGADFSGGVHSGGASHA